MTTDKTTGTIHLKSTIRGGKITYPLAAIASILRERKHAYAMRLAVVDYSTIHSEHWVTGTNLCDLWLIGKEWIDANVWGHWHFCGGDLVDQSGEIIGISNDMERVFKPGIEGNDCFQRLEDLASVITTDQAENTPPTDWFI